MGGRIEDGIFVKSRIGGFADGTTRWRRNSVQLCWYSRLCKISLGSASNGDFAPAWAIVPDIADNGTGMVVFVIPRFVVATDKFIPGQIMTRHESQTLLAISFDKLGLLDQRRVYIVNCECLCS